MEAIHLDDAVGRPQPLLRPPVVELVGPAGSGKTTLARVLCDHAGVDVGIELSRIGHIPHLARHALMLLPDFLRLGGEGGWLSRKEMRSMTYLRAWPRRLTRPQAGRRVTVLDHGPVFRLARLRTFGPELTRSASFDKWWEGSLDIWCGLLDAVVYLDAPDAVLVDRIRSRDEGHRMKAESRSEAERFLGRYRATYDDIIRSLAARGGPPLLLRIDTSRSSAEDAAEIVFAELARVTQPAPLGV